MNGKGNGNRNYSPHVMNEDNEGERGKYHAQDYIVTDKQR